MASSAQDLNAPSSQPHSESCVEKGMVLHLADHSMQACNDYARSIIGSSSPKIFDELLQPDGTRYAEENHPLWTSLSQGLPHKDVILGLSRTDGRQFWLSVDTQPLYQPEQDFPYAVISTFTCLESPSLQLDPSPQTVQLTQYQHILQTVIRELPDVVLIKDLQGTFMAVSQVAADWVGRTVEDLIGQEDSVFFPIEALPRVRQDDLNVIQSKTTSVSEETVYKGTEYRELLVIKYPCYDIAGDLIGLVSVCKDITKLERNKAALKESQARILAQHIEIESIYQTAPIGLAVLNPQLQFERVNQQLANMNGLSIEDHMGRTVREVVPDLADEAEPLLYQILETGEPLLDIELRGETPSLPGVKRVWRESWFPITVQDQVVCINVVCEEVTEQRRLEAERQASEQALRDAHIQLNAALAAGAIYIWRWNIPQDRIILSAILAELFSVDPEIATQEGLPFEDFQAAIHPDDLPQVTNAIQRAIETGEVYTAEYRIQVSSDEERWVLARGQVEYDPQGQPISFPGAIADITERKLAEMALQKSESFKERLLESSPDCIQVLDLEGRQIYMNSGGVCLLEIDDLSAYLQQDWIQFWQGDHLSEAEAALASAINGETGRFQGQSSTSKGTVKWWDVTIAPLFDESGQVDQLLAISRDVSDRKESEIALEESAARFQLMIDLIPQVFWVANEAGSIEYYNQRWETYTGQDVETTMGWDWRPIVHPEDLQPTVARWMHSINTGEFYQCEHRLLRYDGEYRWHLSRALPFQNQAGIIVNWYGTSIDIHDQKNLLDERNQALEREQNARTQAERANRVKDEFLAILSHELRTPLTPIVGWAQVLQTPNLSQKKISQGLETIQRNALLQAQLIDDLLDIARILRGKLKLEMVPVRLASVIEEAINTVKSTAAAKSIVIQADLSRSEQVLGDGGRIQQIVWNLLSNAIKFTPRKGKITIQLRSVDEQAQIRVTDTGKGISAEFLPHLFESFRQEDASITRRHGGLGLGLSIVRYLVEIHGGTIAAESPGEGKGATFIVSLPLLEKPLEDAGADTNLNEIPDLKGVSVLAVDDEPDIRELIKTMLKQYNAKVLTASSAAQALSLLEVLQPDILISDIGMPDVDGYCLMDQIRALPAEEGGQIPAIALTAYARDEDRQEALRHGYQEHIPKPIDFHRLIQTVVNLVR